MLQHRTRLPLSYAATLTTGIWDNTEIMPSTEAALEGVPYQASGLSADLSPALRRPNSSVESATTYPKTKSKTMSTYSDPKDLRTFGKITEWQEEMGENFFKWYSGVTEGDSALTEREKALIALAVSHAIQCSYCIDAYTTNSLQAGADEEQMMEAVHVAAAVKAGTTLIYARQMQRQVEKVTM
ncbi:MAG: arsenosugar biosynthesis-associated peroxidase-like protein, partial [Lewinella sp.]